MFAFHDSVIGTIISFVENTINSITLFTQENHAFVLYVSIIQRFENANRMETRFRSNQSYTVKEVYVSFFLTGLEKIAMSPDHVR